jgi:hypothetical protein
MFEITQSTALHNANILKEHGYGLSKMILSMHPSPLSFRSEFKAFLELEKLLQNHPYWPHLQNTLDHGVKFPLLPTSQ